MAWSLKGFKQALQKISIKSLEFHNSRGDFEKWAEISLRDKTLTEKLKKIRTSKTEGETLRKSLIKAATERFDELNKQIQTATKYF
jgi:methionine synthase II (cobalamin-independent)